MCPEQRWGLQSDMAPASGMFSRYKEALLHRGSYPCRTARHVQGTYHYRARHHQSSYLLVNWPSEEFQKMPESTP